MRVFGANGRAVFPRQPFDNVRRSRGDRPTILQTLLSLRAGVRRSWCTLEWSPGVHWNGLLVYTGMINDAEERELPSASFPLLQGETAPKTAQFSIIWNIRSSFAPYWVAQGVTFPLQRSSMLTLDLPSQHINDFLRNLDGRYTCNSPRENQPK